MQKLKIGITAILAMTSSLTMADVKFGDGAKMDQLQDLAQVMQAPKDYRNQTITVKGIIKEVCHKKGCWMELSAGEQYDNLIVKVKDGDMVFPISSRGKTAYATGVLNSTDLNIEQTKAYLAHRAEENKLEFDPTSVTKGMNLYRLKPTGVTISD
ncbi:DUF4920 domain-containing protein [uncultured Pseudoteredinibacter sp.]|uniref:DUF4920 domain-containing protein n=1 Tax=uncultured Pseudoteredinibacter sp. TaxID=1641701 RepID=UPI002611C5B4|nr:DUF4920 domain-containing protein [uncultured Pseudoteredinibacter sp.]